MRNLLLTIKTKLITFELWCKKPAHEQALRALVKGKRVLILGSGPSASELTQIPDDVIIFACNMSPTILLTNHLPTRLGLYLCKKSATTDDKYGTEIGALLSALTISFFMTDDISHMKKIFSTKSTTKYLTDRSTGKRPDGSLVSEYLPTLLKPSSIDELSGTSAKGTSAGIGLLQYALYFEASHIYLSGIDLDLSGYALGEKTNERYKAAHQDIDTNVLAYLSNKYKNISVLSSSSPVSKKIPVATDWV